MRRSQDKQELHLIGVYLERGTYRAKYSYKDKNNETTKISRSTKIKSTKANKTKEKEALIVAETIRINLEAEIFDDIDMSFLDFMEKYLEKINSDGRLDIGTKDQYKNYYRSAIKPFFLNKNLKVSEITPSVIDDFYSFLSAKNLASNTIRNYVVPLKKALDLAVWEGILEFNPTKMIELPKTIKEPKTKAYLTKEQIDEVLMYLKEHNKLKYYYIVAFNVYYGLRPSEILGLKWDNIDFEAGVFYIREKAIDTKNGMYISNKLKNITSYRNFAIYPDTLKILNEIKERQTIFKGFYGEEYNPHNLVFTSDEGVIINERSMSSYFTSMSKNLGYRVTFQCLRPTCLTHLFDRGVDIKEVQEYAGHKNVSTTLNNYIRPTQEKRKNLEDVASRLYS